MTIGIELVGNYSIVPIMQRPSVASTPVAALEGAFSRPQHRVCAVRMAA